MIRGVKQKYSSGSWSRSWSGSRSWSRSWSGSRSWSWSRSWSRSGSRSWSWSRNPGSEGRMSNKYLDAVNELNSEWYDKHGEAEKAFWYRTTGYADQIGFDENTLWCSEADGTQYIEETDKEMAIIHVVRLAFNKYADDLQRLKFEANTEEKHDDD